MNPLKNLFNKVFESTPSVESPTVPQEDAAFEWNPDEETVAPTSARAVSWKRGDTPDEGPQRVAGEATDADIAASAHNLPTPMFERSPVKSAVGPSSASVLPLEATRPQWNEPHTSAPASEEAPFISVKTTPPPQADSVALTPPPPPPMAAPAASSPGLLPVPLSDFEDVYRKAGIKSPVHGYGVERVYRLLTSRRLVGLDRNVRRSALLTALDAAGVPASDVSQDAVLRRKALTAYEAEKALELQSLRSRNESRAEALQDTVETFTRQKQSQIERLAQGSTSAVRTQSDLEIRKRMEQDRLYRSLAYFVEPLPSPVIETRGAVTAASRVIERFDATIEMSLPVSDDGPVSVDESEVAPIVPSEPEVEVLTVTPEEEVGADTRPIHQAGLEAALRAAAEEARTAGWGRTAIAEDGASDTVEALRRLREAKKTESES
jgi:hypothetical protein